MVKDPVSHPHKNHNYIYVNYNIISSGRKMQDSNSGPHGTDILRI